MGETGEKFVVELIGSRPPAGVLVIDVGVRSHYVERSYGHESVRHNGAGIGGAEVSGAYERVDPLGVVNGFSGGAEAGGSEKDAG